MKIMTVEESKPSAGGRDKLIAEEILGSDTRPLTISHVSQLSSSTTMHLTQAYLITVYEYKIEFTKYTTNL